MIMSTKKYYGREQRASTSLFLFRVLVRKLQASLAFLEAATGYHDHHRNLMNQDDDDDHNLEALPIVVPEDVKEGHFVVLATKGSEKKRFVVKLEWLKRAEFVRLLKLAEEEYGFDQAGALMIPCSPDELENIIRAS